jgi:hypothetical protein
MKYIVEYILNNTHEWSVWFEFGRGTKSGPMSAEQFVAFDKRRKAGEYVFFSVEVLT